MPWPEAVELSGLHATLEPLSAAHRDAMIEAVGDGELSQLWYTSVPSAVGMMAEIERRLELQSRGSMLPFAVLDANGTVVYGQLVGEVVDEPDYDGALKALNELL